MATERHSIPVHKLLESTDQGFQIERVDPRSNAAKDALVMGAHRDDHYIFLVQETGLSKGMVDFHLFTLKGDSVLFILPGQVHSYLETANETMASDQDDTVFYLAGHVPTVVRLRNLLRQKGVSADRVKTQGFWD